MTNITPKPRIWHSIIKKVAASNFGSWLLADNLHRLDRPVLRLTKGRSTLTSLLAGLPVVVLTAKGARSGLPRTLPLAAMQDGSRLVLIASSFGKPNNPSWYYNLKANPEVIVEVGTEKFPALASITREPERTELFEKVAEQYQGFSDYKEKTSCVIPVVTLARL